MKVDVQACFDTIEQSTLLKILKDLISEVTRQVAWSYLETHDALRILILFRSMDR